MYHYFGSIRPLVMDFMMDLDKELYRYERMKPSDIVEQFIKLKK